MDLRFDAGSFVEYDMTYYPIDSSGTATTIRADMTRITITPSLTKRPLVVSDLMEVRCLLRWPLAWNALYRWTYTINFSPVKVYFLYDHITVFTDIVADWMSYAYIPDQKRVGGSGLSFFYPMEYTYEIGFTEFELVLNVNDHNLIDHVNDSKLNTHMIISGPELNATIVTPYRNFNARNSDISYRVSTQNLRAHISFPERHPMNDLLDASKTGKINHFLLVNKLFLDGAYRYHYKYNRSYRDSHTLALKADGLEGNFSGQVLFYILCLKDNYFSSNTSFITSQAFKDAGM